MKKIRSASLPIDLNRVNILLLILLSLNIYTYSQSTDWIDFNQRQQLYPSNKNFIGFCSSDIRKGETEYDLLERLKDNAIGELVEKIYVHYFSFIE